MKALPWEIAETTRSFRRYLDERTAPLGVTTPQWRVIAWVGNKPGMKQVELADRLELEPITVGRAIDRLERKGLIERRPDPDDGRVWRLTLTVKGQQISERLIGLAERMAARAFDGFSLEELEDMRAKLALMRANVSRVGPAMKKSA